MFLYHQLGKEITKEEICLFFCVCWTSEKIFSRELNFYSNYFLTRFPVFACFQTHWKWSVYKKKVAGYIHIFLFLRTFFTEPYYRHWIGKEVKSRFFFLLHFLTFLNIFFIQLSMNLLSYTPWNCFVYISSATTSKNAHLLPIDIIRHIFVK